MQEAYCSSSMLFKYVQCMNTRHCDPVPKTVELQQEALRRQEMQMEQMHKSEMQMNQMQFNGQGYLHSNGMYNGRQGYHYSNGVYNGGQGYHFSMYNREARRRRLRRGL